LDLSHGNVSQKELELRARAVAAFITYTTSTGSLAAVSKQSDPEVVAEALVEYGQHLYDTEKPLGHFRSCVLGMQDRYGSWAPFLKRAWKAISAWEAVEPSCSHVPLLVIAWEAMVAFSLLLGMESFAFVVVVGFVGMLRPGEAIALRRADISLPSDRLEHGGAVFLAVNDHKTRTRGAGAQHAKIRDPVLVAWIEKVVLKLHRARDERMYARSPQTFRREWDFVLRALAVPCLSGVGFTPASLRAGGATAAYELLGAPEVRWRLRHASEKSASRYIQEAGAAVARSLLSEEARVRVSLFARGLDAVLRQCPKTPPAARRDGTLRAARSWRF